MDRVVIWGTAARARMYSQLSYFNKNIDIVAVTDSSNKGNYFNNLIVSDPYDLRYISFDKIVVCSRAYNAIQNKIQEIFEDKSITVEWFDDKLDEFKGRIIDLYKDTDDAEIKHFVEYLKSNPFNIMGPYKGESTMDEVLYDEDGDPYIMLEGKRLYYPKDFEFVKRDGKNYISDVLSEQSSNSPHLYCKNTHVVCEGDVIVDAGTCEGNFALRYADIASKIYLIESSDRWAYPLNKTFKPYRDKVVLCNKYIGRFNSSTTITLDKLVPTEKIDFIKMDIEGAEIDAVLGAKEVLARSNSKLSVCSYHKENDADNIRFLLEAMNYKTSVSSGYMFFIWDEGIFETMDFRRSIVYAQKKS